MKYAARALSLSAALGLLAGCSMFDYSSIVPRRFALVYGVTMYVAAAGASSPNLGYPAADASAVAAMLTAQGYAVTSRWVDASGHIFVNGAQVAQISDTGLPNPNAPTKATIQADLASLKPQVGPNDVVVFYFSGHGMTDNQDEWFVPYGGVDPATGYGVRAMSIEDTEFGGTLGILGTPRKVVILDTCNSGGFIGNTLEVDVVPPASGGGLHLVTPATIVKAIANYFSLQGSANGISPYGGAMVISASGAAESCYETDTLGSLTIDHGVMTYYLLQAAGSGDLNKDGRITALEAFSLVKAGIDTSWNGNLEVQAAGEQFEPRVSGGPVDFVVF